MAVRHHTPALTLAAVPSLAPTPVMPMAAIRTPAASVPAVSTTEGELPWIDQFLASTPVAPMEAVQGPPDAYRYSTPAASAAITPKAELPAEAPATETGDEWPLAEAADALDEISRELGDAEGVNGATPARLFGESATPAPLPAWSDEDLLNIMPVRALTPAPSRAQEAALPDPTGQAQADASAIAAAQALELLAQRVRAGELQLPGYDPKMGDAAALVSALAALLGLRLG